MGKCQKGVLAVAPRLFGDLNSGCRKRGCDHLKGHLQAQTNANKRAQMQTNADTPPSKYLATGKIFRKFQGSYWKTRSEPLTLLLRQLYRVIFGVEPPPLAPQEKGLAPERGSYQNKLQRASFGPGRLPKKIVVELFWSSFRRGGTASAKWGPNADKREQPETNGNKRKLTELPLHR